jgi:hypothetical protein
MMSPIKASVLTVVSLTLFVSAVASVNDKDVKLWIASSLSSDGTPGKEAPDARMGRHYSVDEMESAWRRMKQCRCVGETTDLDMAAAEHYLFMRFVASKNGDKSYQQLPQWYETAKEKATWARLEELLQTTNKPVSPTDPNVQAWGERGVADGLADYTDREHKTPVDSSGALKTLMGSTYAIYYYGRYGQCASGSCQLRPKPQPKQDQ